MFVIFIFYGFYDHLRCPIPIDNLFCINTKLEYGRFIQTLHRGYPKVTENPYRVYQGWE